MTLETKIKDITLKNPLIMASGTFGFGEEFKDYFDISKLGAISSKGLTLNPKDGNTGIRIHETPSGIMNSIGLQNPGIKHFIEYELPEMKKIKTVIIANLGGNDENEYIEGARLLDNTSIDMIELNISCPNVKCGGMAFGIESDVAEDIVRKVRKVTTKHLMVKLSPNARNIIEMGKKCESAGADSLSLVNTFSALAIDIDKKKPVFNNITAGLSGPCIKPIALRMVYDVCKNVSIPVIGIGGIMNYRDVIEYIMAGATAVQIGTANFTDPQISEKIIEDLKNYLIQNKINNFDEIRGII